MFAKINCSFGCRITQPAGLLSQLAHVCFFHVATILHTELHCGAITELCNLPDN